MDLNVNCATLDLSVTREGPSSQPLAL